MALPPCQVLPRSSAVTGTQKVAIANATLLVTNAEGWMCDPFLGHSAKHVKPMCQRLQNAAPPRIGSAIFRHILQVFSPGSRRWRCIGCGFWFGDSLTVIWHFPGVLPPPPPLPAPRLDPSFGLTVDGSGCRLPDAPSCRRPLSGAGEEECPKEGGEWANHVLEMAEFVPKVLEGHRDSSSQVRE